MEHEVLPSRRQKTDCSASQAKRRSSTLELCTGTHLITAIFPSALVSAGLKPPLTGHIFTMTWSFKERPAPPMTKANVGVNTHAVDSPAIQHYHVGDNRKSSAAGGPQIRGPTGNRGSYVSWEVLVPPAPSSPSFLLQLAEGL